MLSRCCLSGIVGRFGGWVLMSFDQFWCVCSDCGTALGGYLARIRFYDVVSDRNVRFDRQSHIRSHDVCYASSLSLSLFIRS